jgi:Putative beta-barrel porin-2, OmpL-like. bbp2
MKRLLLYLFLLNSFWAYGQGNPATTALLDSVHFSAYLELYGAADNPRNDKHQRPAFLYNNTRTGELALNLGLIKANFQNNKIRSNLALMAGTYPDRNLATESRTMQHVYEANIGLRLSSKRNIWLDAGVMNSHIGMESAMGALNPTLTRSMGADNTPYYETGAKCTYINPAGKLTLSALVLNGWQRIYKLDGNYLPALGLQVNYVFNEKLQVNYSNYVGDESKEEDFGMRVFNELYFIYSPTKRISLFASGDVGMQPDFSDDDWPMQYWFSWFGAVKCKLNDSWSLTARMEQFHDPSEVIAVNNLDDGFLMYGYSLNIDYKIAEYALLRLEGRMFDSDNDAFENNDGDAMTNYAGLTASLSVSF